MKNIYLILILTILSLKIQAQIVEKENEEEVLSVSIINLIANPKEYDGKLVSITGFLSLGRESHIFLNRDDFKNNNYKNSIFVLFSTSKAMELIKGRFNKKYVRLIGRFYLYNGGYKVDCCNGLIRDGKIFKFD